MIKNHIQAWLEHYKNLVLHQEIFPNRYHAFFYELSLLCRFRLDKKIAFVPCGQFVIEFQKYFNNPNFYFFDDIQKNIGSFYFLSEIALLERMDYIVIASQKHESTILEKLPKKLYPKVICFGALVENDDFQKELHINITSFEFLKFLICLKKSYQTPLNALLASHKNILFVRQNNYSDVKDKVSIVAQTLGSKAVHENSTVQSPKAGQEIQSRLLDMLVFFLANYQKKHFIFFIPIVMDGYGLTYILKTKFLHVRVIANFTDYIYDLCGYDFRQLLAQNYGWSLAYAEAEYAFADVLVHQNIVDGIVHRHGDIEGSWCHKYKSPHLFFPPYQEIYPQKERINANQKRLVFIGSIHSTEYDSRLFSSIFLEDLFISLIEQGFSVDLYYSQGYKSRAEAYVRVICSKLFKIIEGRPLNELLPMINGQYDWGLLLNDLSKDIESINTNYKYTIPSKIYTYTSIHLPILSHSSMNDATTRLIESSGIGKVLDIKSLSSLSKIINDKNKKEYKKNIIKLKKQKHLSSQNNL